MAGNEDVLTGDWITATLEADATMTTLLGSDGVWDGDAAEATSYPLCQFDAQSPGVEIRGVSTVTIGLNSLWKIVGVTSGKSYSPIIPVAQRIYDLLHGVVEHTVSGGIIMACVREQAFRQETVQGGQDYRYLGGIYRVLAQTN